MEPRPDPTGVPQMHDLPLRERLPEYGAVFGAGLAAAIVVGALIGLSSVPLGDAIGYTIVMLGVVMLLTGGASGGGYTNMGIGWIGSLFGSRVRPDDDFEDADVRRGRRAVVDPRERLRKGLRPQANPRAFWQVIGGFAYIAVGIALLQLFA
ncbi:MAG: hypothetical protein ACE5GC_06550 [Acidimicrobiia bacterium]